MQNKYGNRPLKWVALLLLHQDSACLTWPFGRDDRGRPHNISVGRGSSRKVTRVICAMMNGTPPSAIHHAAHSCGNAHLGCVNPNHLSWKTPVENNRDKERHGTKLYGERNPKAKLRAEQVLEIRRLAALKEMSDSALADGYGISEQLVYFIKTRRIWKHI